MIVLVLSADSCHRINARHEPVSRDKLQGSKSHSLSRQVSLWVCTIPTEYLSRIKHIYGTVKGYARQVMRKLLLNQYNKVVHMHCNLIKLDYFMLFISHKTYFFEGTGERVWAVTNRHCPIFINFLHKKTSIWLSVCLSQEVSCEKDKI